MHEYPKMLYRPAETGHEHESAPGAGDAVTCEQRIVESKEEEVAATAEGFTDTPAPAKRAKKAS